MNKKKILALSLIVCLLATAVVGGTLAYFTDTEDATNTFTAGSVDITLDEAIVEEVTDKTAVDADGNRIYGDLIATGDRTEGDQTYRLYPGQKVTKDPTITIADYSEDCYVAAKVIVKGDIHSLIGVDGYDNIDIHQLVSGGLVVENATQIQDWNGLSMVYETDECVIYQDADKENNTWTMYIFVTEAMAKGEDFVLFDTMTIHDDWDNAEMAKINGMTIKVEAYAAQEYGFVDCFEAITTAFPGAFDFS